MGMMSDITVRVNGIINNTMDESKFVEICSQLFGDDKTVDEYIKLYNDAPLAKASNTVVHRTVCERVVAEVEERLEEEMPEVPTAQDMLDAAADTFSDIAGKPVTIEFAEDE